MNNFITLSNGNKMPIIGMGTSGTGGNTKRSVIHAIEAGYRHFDCAAIYMNEREVGEAIGEKIADGSVERENLFIVNKIWPSFHHPKHVEEALKASLQNMGLDYFDLYLIHWPFSLQYIGPTIDSCRREDGSLVLHQDVSVNFIDTWKALEELYERTLVKAIGISNFNMEQLKRLLGHAKVLPAPLQIECHPYLEQTNLINFCKSKGITVTAYCPFASPGRVWASKAGVKVFDGPALKLIARKHDKSAAQIVLRFLIQLGVSVIPKSVSPERIRSNLDVFSFSLEKEDVKVIRLLNRNLRMSPCKGRFSALKEFPFSDEELL